jgi:diphthamide synthase subunit DPH2
MKIFICTTKHLYHKVEEIKKELEKMGHKITLPNSFDEPLKEESMKKIGGREHDKWKEEMLRLQIEKVKDNDAILVLNYKKHEQENYIGASVFLEIFKAWELHKKVFLMNPIPDNLLKDEIKAIQPIILNGDLTKIK